MITACLTEIKFALRSVSRATHLGLLLLGLALFWGTLGPVYGQDSLGPALNQLFESAKTSKPGSPSRKQADEQFEAAARSLAPAVNPGAQKPVSTAKSAPFGQVSEPEPVVIPSSGKPRLIEFSRKKK